MRTLVHLSDLHFGRLDPAILAPLRSSVQQIAPDLLIVSGDLTQRARAEEFEQARDFLRTLPDPQIIVPGNHDVPLHNLYARFRMPLREYQRFITEDLDPFYKDDEIAVLGINTARSLIWKNGRVNVRQINQIEERFCDLTNAVKVLVTHHPFDLPEQHGRADLVGRARRAMVQIARCNIDLLLAGHFHVSQSGRTASRYQIPGHSAIFVQAGTISTRARGEANSFNALHIDKNRIVVERYGLSGEESFRPVSEQSFGCTPTGWT